MKALVVAAAVLAGIVVTGFGLQAVAIGRPTAARLQLVRTLAGLVRLDQSRAAVELNDKRYSSTCTEWRIGRERISSVVIDRWQVLRAVNGGLVGRRPYTISQLELAACPRSLIHSLLGTLTHRPNVRVFPAMLAGRLVVRIPIRDGKRRLELFVSAADGRPVRLVLLGKRWHGASVLRYGKGH
jgi:hypothetical protein